MTQDQDFIAIDPADDDAGKILLSLCAKTKRGKTYGALALCEGLGGLTVLGNTEPKRGSIYKGMFPYKLVNFQPPFSIARFHKFLDYVESLGADNLILDSGSDQWTGAGGVLEAQSKLADDLADKWRTTSDKTTLAAWSKIRPEEDRLLDRILRMDANVIICLRQEEKTKPVVRTNDRGRRETVIEKLDDQLICTKKLPFLTHANIQLLGDGRYTVIEGETIIKPLQPIFERHPTITRELGADIKAWLTGGSASKETKPATVQEKRQSDVQMDEINFDDLEEGRQDIEALEARTREVFDSAKEQRDRQKLIAYIREQSDEDQKIIQQWLSEGRFGR